MFPTHLLITTLLGAFPCDSLLQIPPPKWPDPIQCQSVNPENLRTYWKNWNLENGYPFAQWIQNDTQDSLWDIHSSLGPYITLEDLVLIGSVHTQNSTLRRWLQMEAGQALKISDLQQFQNTLNESELYQVDTVFYQKRPNRNRMLLSAKITQFPRNQFNAQFSAQKNEWKGVFDLELKDMAGTLRELQVHAQGLEQGREMTFSYLEPWLFNLPFGAQFKQSWQQKDTASQSFNTLFTLKNFWTPKTQWGMDFGLYYWQSTPISPWQKAYSYGLNATQKTLNLHLNEAIQQIQGDTLQILALSAEGEYKHQWSSRIHSSQRLSGAKLFGADSSTQDGFLPSINPIKNYRGLRFLIRSPHFLSHQGELLFKFNEFKGGLFSDQLYLKAWNDWNFVWGPFFAIDKAEQKIKTSIAFLPTQNWNQTLIHFEFIQKF